MHKDGIAWLEMFPHPTQTKPAFTGEPNRTPQVLILRTRFTGGATVNWGNPAWVEFPLRLRQFGLPPLDLPMTLHTQIDGLDHLTRLDCVGTGYYPSESLSCLKVRPSLAPKPLMTSIPWQYLHAGDVCKLGPWIPPPLAVVLDVPACLM